MLGLTSGLGLPASASTPPSPHLIDICLSGLVAPLFLPSPWETRSTFHTAAFSFSGSPCPYILPFFPFSLAFNLLSLPPHLHFHVAQCCPPITKTWPPHFGPHLLSWFHKPFWLLAWRVAVPGGAGCLGLSERSCLGWWGGVNRGHSTESPGSAFPKMGGLSSLAAHPSPICGFVQVRCLQGPEELGGLWAWWFGFPPPLVCLWSLHLGLATSDNVGGGVGGHQGVGERQEAMEKELNPLLFLLPVSKRGTSLGWGQDAWVPGVGVGSQGCGGWMCLS